MAFNNIFDSSTIDYAENFEKKDIVYKNKVEYGEKLLTETVADRFVETFIDNEFSNIISNFFLKIEDKLDEISKNEYVNNAYSNWSYDGIPETVRYYICGKKDKECVKLFGVDVENPEKEPNCEAYNTVECNVIDDYINNKEIKKKIAKELSKKIEEYTFRVIEDLYLEDLNK